ncbi:protein RKD1-like protein [Carex littledalei]|uniref:Protein RKD1-like protein n=1 Tax=Carex littledalei TaxID=544730 RepID=A0A833R2G4_9POAL|nr:protein RKD1-like protein [Carex littledalei]
MSLTGPAEFAVLWDCLGQWRVEEEVERLRKKCDEQELIVSQMEGKELGNLSMEQLNLLEERMQNGLNLVRAKQRENYEKRIDELQHTLRSVICVFDSREDFFWTGMRGVVNGLTFEMVTPFFKQPLGVAARELGISRSSLMIWSRVHHIPRWPYRMIMSMEKLITIVKLHGIDYKCQVKGLDFTVEELERRKRSFEKDPSVSIEASILHFRTIMLKRAASKRQKVVRQHNG